MSTEPLLHRDYGRTHWHDHFCRFSVLVYNLLVCVCALSTEIGRVGVDEVFDQAETTADFYSELLLSVTEIEACSCLLSRCTWIQVLPLSTDLSINQSINRSIAFRIHVLCLSLSLSLSLSPSPLAHTYLPLCVCVVGDSSRNNQGLRCYRRVIATGQAIMYSIQGSSFHAKLSPGILDHLGRVAMKFNTAESV